jgi:toxin ParE1/3/4
MNSVIIEPEARDDIAAAMRYYEGEWERLGQKFLDELNSQLMRVAENPRQYPVYRRETHKVVMQRFPFLVFYRFKHERVYVIAVMDGRQSKRKLGRAAGRKSGQ